MFKNNLVVTGLNAFALTSFSFENALFLFALPGVCCSILIEKINIISDLKPSTC